MKEFLKTTGSAFIGCFLAIWTFRKCKESSCTKTAKKEFKEVAKKVEEKVEEIQTPKEEKEPENPTFVEVEVETEQSENQAVKQKKVVSSATEVAQGIY